MSATPGPWRWRRVRLNAVWIEGPTDAVGYFSRQGAPNSDDLDLIAAAPDLLAALKEIIPLVTEVMYGGFMGGDPRMFKPDVEENTPEELAAWKAACEEWNQGEGTDRGPSCATFGDASAYTGTGFGIGTTTWEHEAVAIARAAIAKATGE